MSFSDNAARKQPFVPIEAKSVREIELDHELNDLMRCDKYQIQQPYIQILKEGYAITSEDGSEHYSAVRPKRHFKSLLAKFAGILMAIVGAVLFSYLVFGVFKFKSSSSQILSVLAGLGFFASVALGYILTVKLLMPLRITTLHKGDTGNLGAKVFSVAPSSGVFFFNHEYYLKDGHDKPVIVFKRPYLNSLLQTKWHAYDMHGKYLFTAKEDNLILSILRRYLWGLYRFIPMHFHISKGSGKPFGSFKRRWSLRDKYSLEFSPKHAQGWVVLAAAILLDTGEAR